MDLCSRYSLCQSFAAADLDEAVARSLRSLRRHGIEKCGTGRIALERMVHDARLEAGHDSPSNRDLLPVCYGAHLDLELENIPERTAHKSSRTKSCIDIQRFNGPLKKLEHYTECTFHDYIDPELDLTLDMDLITNPKTVGKGKGEHRRMGARCKYGPPSIWR